MTDLARRIIPCLDVKNGRVVKGVKFQNLADVGDPVELATFYANAGADEITFLDITATLEERNTTLDVVRRTAEQLFVPLTVGGGIRTWEDIRDTLRAGADKIGINSAAVRTPDLINEGSRDFGAQCIVVAIDSRRTDIGHHVHIAAGSEDTGINTIAWAREVADRGAGEILLTSMDADGTTDGYDIKLIREVRDAVSIPVIASGGCGSPQHIVEVFENSRCDAALAASIFHYGTHTIHEVKSALQCAGIPVRLSA